MGTWHGLYARRAGAQVVAVVDPQEARAHTLARRLGAHAYVPRSALAEQDDWLATSGAEVVHLCTPLDSHVPLTIAALEGDCHVVVEKPLAPTLEETRHLLDLASARKRRLIAVHQMPFMRGMRQLLERRADLGTLVRVEHRACTAGAEGRDPSQRRAVLHGILPHSLSLFQALEPEPVGVVDAWVEVDAWKIALDGADALELTASRGPTEWVVSLHATARPTVNELVVWGTEGAARVDLFHGFCVFEPGRVSRSDKVLRPFRLGAGLLLAAGYNLAVRTLTRQPAYPGLLELFRAFYGHLEDAGPSPVSEREILSAAALGQRLMAETPTP